jgi:hypothetical protein
MSEESSELVATGREERSLRSCTTGFALINPDPIFLFLLFFTASSSSSSVSARRSSSSLEAETTRQPIPQDEGFADRTLAFVSDSKSKHSVCVCPLSQEPMAVAYKRSKEREREDCRTLSTIPASSQKERGKRATPSDNNEA